MIEQEDAESAENRHGISRTESVTVLRCETIRSSPMSSQPMTPDSSAIRALILELLPGAEGQIIFGEGGLLDSLGLVNFLADLEYTVGARFGQEIVIASERAMSRGRSPFRDVDTLAEFVGELLAEGQR